MYLCCSILDVHVAAYEWPGCEAMLDVIRISELV